MPRQPKMKFYFWSRHWRVSLELAARRPRLQRRRAGQLTESSRQTEKRVTLSVLSSKARLQCQIKLSEIKRLIVELAAGEHIPKKFAQFLFLIFDLSEE